MAEGFLEPSDDTEITVVQPEDQMPGLAGYVKVSLKTLKMVVAHTSNGGTSVQNFRGVYDSTTQYRFERSKFLSKLQRLRFLRPTVKLLIFYLRTKISNCFESTPVPSPNIVEFAHLKTPLDDEFG